MEYLHKNHKAVTEYFDGLNDTQMIQYHNDFCDRSGYEDQIYDNNEEFFEIYFSSIIEAVKAVQNGNYNISDNYVSFDGLGNLVTTDNPMDFIDVDVLINDAMVNPEKYGIEFIDSNDLND